jgi:YesN/AraC family two-component response regulator
MLFSIVLLVGAAIALLMARIQYHPISALAEFANSKSKSKRPNLSSGENTRPENELERIRLTLQEYSSRADLQEPYARNHFLLMLLKYGSTQSLSPDLLDTFDIQFDRTHHFVMVMGRDEIPGRQEGLHNWQSIIQLLAEAELPELGAHAYCVELPDPDRLAIIVSFNLSDAILEYDHMSRIVETMRSNVLEMFSDRLTIGVGSCYASSSQLNQSFIEACSAFNRMSTGNGSITFFEKVSYTPEQTFWIPANMLLKLSQSLKQGSYDVAVQVIGEAIENVRTSGISVMYIRCIGFDILNTMLKTAAELGIHHVTPDDIPHISTFQSLSEFERSLVNLASRICEQVERNMKKEEYSLMDQITAYIDNHYRDHTLSLDTISYEYAISPSYFSRSFKEKMGINFIQYIWQKRMEEVMHLLKTTNEPLKNIITQIGYLDTPNFIRKFKKETGLTPGQYRKLYSDSGDETAAGDEEAVGEDL